MDCWIGHQLVPYWRPRVQWWRVTPSNQRTLLVSPSVDWWIGHQLVPYWRPRVHRWRVTSKPTNIISQPVRGLVNRRPRVQRWRVTTKRRTWSRLSLWWDRERKHSAGACCMRKEQSHCDMVIHRASSVIPSSSIIFYGFCFLMIVNQCALLLCLLRWKLLCMIEDYVL